MCCCILELEIHQYQQGSVKKFLNILILAKIKLLFCLNQLVFCFVKMRAYAQSGIIFLENISP